MEKLDIRAPSTAPAVVTAIRALDALTSLHGSATLDELTRVLDEPRSSVHRILNTLVENELLQRPGQRGGYRMGPKVMTWGSTFLQAVNIIDEFRAVAAPVVARLDETMQLAVLDWPDVVFVAHLDSRRPVRLATEVGRRLPAHATAAGKVLLAFSGCRGRQISPCGDAQAHEEDCDLGRRAGSPADQDPAPGLGRSQPGGLRELDVPGCAHPQLRWPGGGRDDYLRAGTIAQALLPPAARKRAPRRLQTSSPARSGRLSLADPGLSPQAGPDHHGRAVPTERACHAARTQVAPRHCQAGDTI